MNRFSRLIALLCLLVGSSAHASPAEALVIRKSYQQAMDKWALEMRIATTAEERAKIWDNRPKAAPFAKQMWDSIGSSLDQEWTIEPAVWFLRTTAGLLTLDANGSGQPAFATENEAIRKAVESQHSSSPKLIPMCAALAASPNPRSLAVLEKIQSSHPDPKTQGVAALGAAMQLKSLGDDGEIMRKRLTYLRKAIIQSSDVDLDGVTVAKLAEDELHIIRFLTKGRTAPDLVGVDSASRPLSLAANKGKIIVLLFWNSAMPDATRVIEITNKLTTKFKGRPLAVIGVNNDPEAKLRALEADDTVTWPSFTDPENKLAKEFRIGQWPVVFVLDGERKIHYVGTPGSFAELTAEALLSEVKPVE
ncbi:TlpA family protein disulfide reductase [bacterium]|nr:TlpA family protein disulfide reductase [bacterium]